MFSQSSIELVQKMRRRSGRQPVAGHSECRLDDDDDDEAELEHRGQRVTKYVYT